MRDVVSTKDAPGAIGPYSQAIAIEGLVFCSGQVGLDPVSGELVDGLEPQVQRALENLKGVLEAAGASLASVVKTTVFLTSMDDFAAMNAIYERFFPQDPPARSTIAVSGLPKGAVFEVEAIALRG
ncbi:MAG TPA: Rid family detoxifying hydrolase [Actinomycetota bacterium]|nr:Rid family detoxifying hydrolase [Actinomycetota bacterium]